MQRPENLSLWQRLNSFEPVQKFPPNVFYLNRNAWIASKTLLQSLHLKQAGWKAPNWVSIFSASNTFPSHPMHFRSSSEARKNVISTDTFWSNLPCFTAQHALQYIFLSFASKKFEEFSRRLQSEQDKHFPWYFPYLVTIPSASNTWIRHLGHRSPDVSSLSTILE